MYPLKLLGALSISDQISSAKMRACCVLDFLNLYVFSARSLIRVSPEVPVVICMLVSSISTARADASTNLVAAFRPTDEARPISLTADEANSKHRVFTATNIVALFAPFALLISALEWPVAGFRSCVVGGLSLATPLCSSLEAAPPVKRVQGLARLVD
jgi:hypothetical protein